MELEQPRKSRAPLLITCLIVLIALGVFVGINVRQATNRSHSLLTNSRIRELATAVEAYASDFNHYPNPSTLSKDVYPKYTRVSMYRDGWGNPLRYECWQVDPTVSGCDHYAIASAGADGKFNSTPLRDVTKGFFEDWDEDTVFSNGEFVRYPRPPRGMRN